MIKILKKQSQVITDFTNRDMRLKEEFLLKEAITEGSLLLEQKSFY